MVPFNPPRLFGVLDLIAVGSARLAVARGYHITEPILGPADTKKLPIPLPACSLVVPNLMNNATAVRKRIFEQLLTVR